MHQSIAIDTPKDFHFENTVFSHGWCVLAPFSVTANPTTLQTNLRLDQNYKLNIQYRWNDRSKSIIAIVDEKKPLKKKQIDQIISLTKEIFFFRQDLISFYSFIKSSRDFSWAVKINAGRMLRAPTFFEDLVKMILTTNCSWSFTTVMCKNLITHCSSDQKEKSVFPVAEEISEHSEKFLREKVKLGYRSPFIKKLADDVSNGRMDIESFRQSNESTQELFKRLRAIKGVGDYASGNLLKLLGRFDYLGLDSWCRNKFAEIHSNGKAITDHKIEKHYARFGEWKGLALWLDVTKEWYQQKFPFVS